MRTYLLRGARVRCESNSIPALGLGSTMGPMGPCTLPAA